MRVKVITYAVLVFCILYLTYCNGQINNGENSLRETNIKVDTVVKDIPADKNAASYQINKTNIEKKLGINTLENGFNGLQIRLWYGYSFKDTGQLVIFNNTSSQWSAELYTLIYLYDDRFDLIRFNQLRKKF